MSTLRSWVMLALMVLPIAGIGWVGGMIWMRRIYLEQLRREKSKSRRLARLLTGEGRRTA